MVSNSIFSFLLFDYLLVILSSYAIISSFVPVIAVCKRLLSASVMSGGNLTKSVKSKSLLASSSHGVFVFTGYG